ELCGGLTLGDTLGSQLPVLLKEVRTLESIPAWLAVRVALLRVLDAGAHSDLLCSSLAFDADGSGWRGRPLISTSIGVEPLITLGSYGGQVADPMIEALLPTARVVYGAGVSQQEIAR